MDLEDILITGHDAKAAVFMVAPGSATLTREVVEKAAAGVTVRRAYKAVVLHHRGELQIGPRIKLWCVCGFRWEGEGRRAAEEAWNGHLDEA